MTKKKKPKWKSTKKFLAGATIDLNTGKTKHKYIKAKTPEQERALEKFEAERIIESWKILLGDKFNWFVRNLEYFIDKYGEKEFARRWEKAMKGLKKKEKPERESGSQQ